MKIKQIEYGKTINIGDYESIRIFLRAELEEKESYQEAMIKLRKAILKLEKQETNFH